MFALSYLSDSPLDWFQIKLNSALLDGAKLPAWFRSFAAFVSELRRVFGPIDAVTAAVTALEALQYSDVTKANRYTIDFNQHSYRTGWNDPALARQYYKGLPDRLKDEITRVGKPAALKALQDLALLLDQRYWERQSELEDSDVFSFRFRSHSHSPASLHSSSAPSSRNSHFLTRSPSHSRSTSSRSSLPSASSSHASASSSRASSPFSHLSHSASASDAISDSSSLYLSARSRSASPFPQDPSDN